MPWADFLFVFAYDEGEFDDFDAVKGINGRNVLGYLDSWVLNGACDVCVPAVGIQSWRQSSKVKYNQLDKEHWDLAVSAKCYLDNSAWFERIY